ncbi:hypothetical protein VTJ04DRAFT_10955, partial [Mycothermus thermophilus]
LISRIYRC